MSTLQSDRIGKNVALTDTNALKAAEAKNKE